ncbi:MAG: cytochrome-c peroxidase [Gammaproteobacteria bacterium]
MSTTKYVALCLLWFAVISPLTANNQPNGARDDKLGALPTNEQRKTSDLETLGQLLFFDQSLSRTGQQSCASCHDPARAFMDSRHTPAEGAVSVGDDGKSFGTRNTPSISYVRSTPPFTLDNEGYLGGFFLDGRAADLAAQVLEPFVNPVEMALADHDTLANKVAGNSNYRPLLADIIGEKSLDDKARILAIIAEALVTFQNSASFSTFDSKYDRYLAGEARLTDLEERGRSLFFSQLANCSQCHLLNTGTVTANETFTNYRYHNIGIPENEEVRKIAADPSTLPDRGLLNNPRVNDPKSAGKFKVPSLRNVAITGPYMHNGVFRDLETTVHFYNQFIVKNARTKTNPETGEPWKAPEIPENISFDILKLGQPMDEQRIAAIVAFLHTLTDKRFEALLQ